MTRLDKQAVLAGDTLIVDMVDVKYRGVIGKPVRPKMSMRMFVQPLTADSGAATVDHYWLLPAADYQRLAAISGVEAELDYCSATFDAVTGFLAVDCFKHGSQPTQLVAYLDGALSNTRIASRRAEYTPASLDFWGGFRHRMQLRSSGGQMPKVKVTAFEARAHFDRQIVVPGVLGGVPTACPAP